MRDSNRCPMFACVILKEQTVLQLINANGRQLGAKLAGASAILWQAVENQQ